MKMETAIKLSGQRLSSGISISADIFSGQLSHFSLVSYEQFNYS